VSDRVAGTEHPSRRTEQLPRPAGRSRRERRPPIRDPRLSRPGSGRNLEGNMADRQRHCPFRDDFSRIRCVSQWVLGRFDAVAAIDGDRSFFCYCFPSRNANLETVQMRLPRPA